ncbi:MAG TPA: hypothetical protein VN700_07805 [Vicinamibacterales bacterium]|nr:hypothetical protein [Vicinamibacterales bacterium]
MFGHKHYVSVMRAKPAELRALRDLAPALRPWTTPLLECPLRVVSDCQSRRDFEAKFDAIVRHLSGWSRRTVFLDFSMVREEKPHSIEVIADRAALLGIRPVPVVSVKVPQPAEYDRSIQVVLSRHGSSLGLRVSPEVLRSESIGEMVQARLARFGASPSQVDLLIDRGGVDAGSVTYQEFAYRIPSIEAWRTLTVLAGSFPKDLADLARNETHRLRRFEFRQWRDLGSWSGRRPAFGDYTVQHVVFREPVSVPNLSASIRYTIEDDFLVLRGEGVLNPSGPGRGQWSAWAALLAEMPEFFGATFSAGDRYVVERARDWSNPGTAQKWLQAAFSHHVTTTALQVAGRLDRVREVAANVSDWTSVVDLGRPEAAL